MSKFKVGDVVHRVTGIDKNYLASSGVAVTISNIYSYGGCNWVQFEEDEINEWDLDCFALVPEEIPNNSKQNPNNIPNFQLRWTIYETTEELHNSWNSEGKVTVVKQSKPILQYSVDGVEWNNVPEVVIKTN